MLEIENSKRFGGKTKDGNSEEETRLFEILSFLIPRFDLHQHSSMYDSNRFSFHRARRLKTEGDKSILA